MLKRLELNYFKKHEHLQVDFSAGLNGIIGANYRGKSTILMGILYCLGGSRMVPGKRLVTRGTNSGFKQRLWFTIPHKGDYLVERTKTSANLYRECSTSLASQHPDAAPMLKEAGAPARDLVATGASPVNTAIAELLGMPLRRFAQIKLARQKAADAILKYGSGELFKIVTELTGLGRIGTVLAEIESDLKVQLKTLEALAPTQDLASLEARLEALAQEIDPLQEQRITAEAEMHSTGSQFRQLRGELQALNDQIGKARMAEIQMQRAHARYQEIEAQATRTAGELQRARNGVQACLQQIGPLAEPLAPAGEVAKVLEAKAAQLLQTATEAESSIRWHGEANRVAEQATQRVEALEARLQAAYLPQVPDSERLAEVRTLLDKVQTELRDLQARRTHLTKCLSDGACATCRRPFDNFDPKQTQDDLARTMGEIDERTKGRDALAQQEASLLAAQRDYDKAVSVRETLEVELRAAFTAQRDALAKSLELAALAVKMPDPAALRAQAAKLTEQRQSLAVACGHANHAALADQQAQADLVAAGMEVKHASQALGTLLGDGQNLETLQVQVGELAERVSAAEERAMQADQHWTSISSRLSSLAVQHAVASTELATARAEREKHEQATLRAQRLGRLRDLIRSNRDRYSRQVWDVFMTSASLSASTVTGGAIQNVSRDSDGNFTFSEEGFEMALEEASGAQLAIIGIAVQVALAESAQCPLDILLLDEPTADMDDEHALAFSTMLARSGKQVVMVTHRGMDAAVFDNTISLGA